MKKKNHIKVRFSTILLCIPAILLCAAPCGWADGSYLYDGDIDIYYLDDGEICDITEDLYWLNVRADTTVNLYADVSQYVLVHHGGVLNIYSGSVVDYVIVSGDEPYAVVTVYGTGFAVNGQPVSHGQVAINDIGELTGTYGGENGGDISLKFLSGVPINLKPPAVSEVEIDIKPGGNPNNINLRSKGVVPVAVLTTDDFNANTIDPENVLFAGAVPVRSTLEDVDEDGDLDMLFHFKIQKLNLEEDSTTATLTGETTKGVGITATNTVRIVQSKKK